MAVFNINRFWLSNTLMLLLLAGDVSAFSLAENVSSKGYARLAYQERTPNIDKSSPDLKESIDAQYELDWNASDISLDTLSFFKYRGRYTNADKAVKDNMEFESELREWVFTYESTSGSYKFGRQQVAWGKGDYFRIVDVINPLDLRDGLITYIDDYSLGREPRNMAVIEHFSGDIEYQFIAANQTQETLYAPQGADFSVPGYSQDYELESNNQLDLGVRVRMYLDGTDLDFYAFDGYHPDPVLSFDAQNKLIGQFSHRQLLAVSFAQPISWGILRSDIAYYTKEPIQLENGFESAQKFDVLFGFDAQKNEWILNLQGVLSQYLNVSSAYTKRDRIVSASLYLEKQWSRLRLTSSFLALYNYQDNSSSLYKYLLGYEWFNATELEAGIITFQGESDTLHGMFASQDRVYISLKHSF